MLASEVGEEGWEWGLIRATCSHTEQDGDLLVVEISADVESGVCYISGP